MKAEVDPRLVAQIDEAGDEGEVEAFVVVSKDTGAAGTSAEGGTGQQVVARVSEQVQEQPTAVRHLPRLGVTYVKASGKLVRQLLEEDEVVAASANDAQITAD
jgi:hypothetical protein